jgi:hypothetical protein
MLVRCCFVAVDHVGSLGHGALLGARLIRSFGRRCGFTPHRLVSVRQDGAPVLSILRRVVRMFVLSPRLLGIVWPLGIGIVLSHVFL